MKGVVYSVSVGAVIPVLFGDATKPVASTVVKVTAPLFKGRAPCIHVESDSLSGWFEADIDSNKEICLSDTIYPRSDRFFNSANYW